MKRNLAEAHNSKFDLIVIGGGIYGATIAWDATLRGLSVALIEKGDFGQATSANSLKTIHGGLRYLQKLDLKRMRESVRERTNLMRIAPHLVHPLPCLIPTYGHTFRGREIMGIALKLNDLISFDRNQLRDPQKYLPPGRIISKEECLDLLPGLKPDGLTGGAIWFDGQMYNSERLTLSFVLSAVKEGAFAANYLEAIGFLKKNGRVTGIVAQDKITQDRFDLRARAVVVAAGPWTDHILGFLNEKAIQIDVQLAKAINVGTRQLLDQYAIGLSDSSAFERDENVKNRGGRFFFIAPWRDRSIIGTTYQYYTGDLDHLHVTEQELQELIEGVNCLYPPFKLSLCDVLFVHCGLVPISGFNPRTGNVKRANHYTIRNHTAEGLDGLISILGVKYTTARDVAEKVVDLVFRNWKLNPPASRSAYVPLFGGDIEQLDSFQEAEIKKQLCGLDEKVITELIYNYGTIYPKVLSYIDNDITSSLESQEYAILKAQVIYSVRHEMALKLSDVILRRTGLGTVGYPGDDKLVFCANIMREELGWDSGRLQREILEVKESFPNQK